MPYCIRDTLSWCLCGGRAVFLDLASDRYFRLCPENDRSFQEWARSGATIGFDPAGLVRAGVLVACDAARRPLAMTEVPTPSLDLGEEPGTRPRAADIVSGLVAQRRAASVLRRGQLSSLVDAIRADRDLPLARDGDGAVRRIAAAFASTLLSFRKAGQCLPRALAAYALCKRIGVTPTLVFGVRLEPFAAHCWLQLGPDIIVGDLEQVRMFVPILAVP